MLRYMLFYLYPIRTWQDLNPRYAIYADRAKIYWVIVPFT